MTVEKARFGNRLRSAYQWVKRVLRLAPDPKRLAFEDAHTRAAVGIDALLPLLDADVNELLAKWRLYALTKEAELDEARNKNITIAAYITLGKAAGAMKPYARPLFDREGWMLLNKSLDSTVDKDSLERHVDDRLKARQDEKSKVAKKRIGKAGAIRR